MALFFISVTHCWLANNGIVWKNNVGDVEAKNGRTDAWYEVNSSPCIMVNEHDSMNTAILPSSFPAISKHSKYSIKGFYDGTKSN
jgi:hypothetical protein